MSQFLIAALLAVSGGVSLLAQNFGLAQGAERRFQIQGEVLSDSTLPDGLVIEIFHPQSRAVVDRAIVTGNGQFSFQGVTAGTYEYVIRNDYGDVLRRDYITAHEASFHFVIRLQKLAKTQEAIRGVISARSLRHRPPKDAVKAFKKAEDLRKRGDIAGSLVHLEKAVAVDPEFAEAHSNLGVRYLESNNVSKAREAFEAAVRLDPASVVPLVNLASVYLRLGMSDEALLAARRAVAMPRVGVHAEYMLGLALLQKQQFNEETLRYLRNAAEVFPRAKLSLATVLVRTGQTEQARKVLQGYLDTGTPEVRSQVQSWIKALR